MVKTVINKLYVIIGCVLLVIGSLSFIYGSMTKCSGCKFSLSQYFMFFGIILFGIGVIILILNLLFNRRKLKKFESELKKEVSL